MINHILYGIGEIKSAEISKNIFKPVRLVVKFDHQIKNLPASELRRVRGLSFSTKVLLELRHRRVYTWSLRMPNHGIYFRKATVTNPHHPFLYRLFITVSGSVFEGQVNNQTT